MLLFYIRYVPVLCFFGVAALVTLRDVLGYPQGIDVDHFMYFGQRVVAGELPWQVEFDDKLPMVQFMFAVPAAMGTLVMWQGMSVISAGLAAVLIYLHIRQLDGIDKRRGLFLGWLAAGLLFYLFSMLSGTFVHLNAMAASLAMSSTLLFWTAMSRRRRVLFVTAALLGSLSLGLRPYFLLVVLSAPVWWMLRSRTSVGDGIKISGLWVVCVGCSGLVVNALPYVITGQVDVFIAGLSLLAESLIPVRLTDTVMTFAKVLLNETPPLFLVLYGMVPFCVLILVTQDKFVRGHIHIRADLVYFGIVVPALLMVMIFSKHFWDHYLQFFVPYLAFSTALIVWLVSRTWQITAHSSIVSFTIAAVIATSGLDSLARAARFVLAPPQHSESGRVLELVTARLEEVSGPRPSFLVPGNMRLHWQLAEPRRGFLHAANASFVHLGWWDDIPVQTVLDVPTSEATLCARLAAHPVDIILLPSEDASRACRSYLEPAFRLALPLSEDEARHFDVWVRAL